MVWCVLLAVLCGTLLAAGLVLQKVYVARTQAQWVVQQTQQADLWARMLTARMEAHQRLLTSVAQGMHSSLLDKPAVLDALMQQDGSMLQLFESLHVALPDGSISHHGGGVQRFDLDSHSRDALRRTLQEGKPSVTHVQWTEDVHHLRVLLAVPMRLPDGRVSGALAAMVKLPLASLLPQADTAHQGLQYVLLSAQGVVLAHSDADQRWRNIQDLLAGYGAQWRALSEPSTANADTQVWGEMVASRVGLPLPQWQAVILRDIQAPLQQLQTLPRRVWLAAAAAVLGLSLLGVVLLWLLAVRHGPLWYGQLAPATQLASHTQQQEAADAQLQSQWLQQGSLAMLESVPSTMLLEQNGWVRLGTPQLLAVLGYNVQAAEPVLLTQWLAEPQALPHIRNTLMDIGSYEGVLAMRKKDGDVVRVEALGWSPAQLPDASVWHLRLPWRQRRAVPLPDQEHAWQDHLTRLPNREAFMWGLQAWASDSVHTPKGTGLPSTGCLLFADVDHLGMINETIAREMGNKVLRHVGRLMSNYTQPLGDAARLGGDEFAVLLPGISVVHAQAIGQALCDAVWRWQPTWNGERHWVSLSVGVVAMDAQRHHPEQALRAADMACYEAKRQGRCQVAVGQIRAHTTLAGAS